MSYYDGGNPLIKDIKYYVMYKLCITLVIAYSVTCCADAVFGQYFKVSVKQLVVNLSKVVPDNENVDEKSIDILERKGKTI